MKEPFEIDPELAKALIPEFQERLIYWMERTLNDLEEYGASPQFKKSYGIYSHLLKELNSMEKIAELPITMMPPSSTHEFPFKREGTTQ